MKVYSPRFHSAAGQRAYTLVEVVCSALIGAILFAALFSGINAGYRIVRQERENLRATQVILTRMEGLRLEAWGTNQLFNPALVPTNFTDSFYPLGLGGSTSSTGVVYSGTMQITPGPYTNNPPAYNTNLALVTVTVTWTDQVPDGRNLVHTRTMRTYVAQYGVQNYIYNH
ncbi:MAG TPA: type II secretion system protein [Verrucomicrobiae bacterium]|nr:type II secretion system protein [Verrucomicrobiae bacterium]